MKIIVDPNIIIASLINPDGKYGEILLNPPANIEFYAPELSKQEYEIHRNKVISYIKVDYAEFRELEFVIFSSLTILPHVLVPNEVYQQAFSIMENIDVKDTAFVAFALWLNQKIWTLDEGIISALKNAGYPHLIISTEELINR